MSAVKNQSLLELKNVNFDFPENILPEKLYNLFVNISERYNTRVEAGVLSAFTVLGSLMGANRKVQANDDHIVLHNQYFCLVGSSGSGKSPLMKHIVKPVRNLDVLLYEKHNQSILVDDVTPEALHKAFLQNPQGLLIYKTELGTFFAETYRNSTRANVMKERLLELFDGEPWKKERASEKFPMIPEAVLGIAGAVTTDRFCYLFSDEELASGLFQRFYFIYMVPQIRYYPKSIRNADVTDYLSQLYEYIVLSRPENEVFIRLSPEAYIIYERWFNDVSVELLNAETRLSAFSGFLSKHRDLPLKFSSILYHIELFDGCDYETIQVHHINYAIKLTEYVRLHTKYLWQIVEPQSNRDNSDIHLFSYLKSLFDNSDLASIRINASDLVNQLNRYLSKDLGLLTVYSVNKIGRIMSRLGVRRVHDKGGNHYIVMREQFYKEEI